MEPAAMPGWYRGMRAAVFALLAVNTMYYSFSASLSKALDAAAWLLLLALYTYETRQPARRLPLRTMLILNALKLLAILGIAASAIGYIVERDVLDALNTALWIAVICLLEIEVRWPRGTARLRAVFAVAAAGLYGSLGLLVALWAWRGEWFDAYDGLLWLVAFATLEMDVLGVART